jgi:3-isopropylmalate dehydratase small subunit
MFPQQAATCTKGPSVPKLRPADTANIIPTDFVNNVHFRILEEYFLFDQANFMQYLLAQTNFY